MTRCDIFEAYRIRAPVARVPVKAKKLTYRIGNGLTLAGHVDDDGREEDVRQYVAGYTDTAFRNWLVNDKLPAAEDKRLVLAYGRSKLGKCQLPAASMDFTDGIACNRFTGGDRHQASQPGNLDQSRRRRHYQHPSPGEPLAYRVC